MRVLSSKNTMWRDSYDRIRRWSLLVAIGLHAFILLALPRVIADRLFEEFKDIRRNALKGGAPRLPLR